MRRFILFLFLLSSTTIFSQINFQKGYFIDKDNQKVNCLIKNKDWSKIPESFEFKLSENDEVQTTFINNVQEFRILDTDLFYIKYKLKQDIRDENYKLINLKGDDIFLKVLLKGDGSIFEYFNGDSYFFYELDDNGIVLIPIPKKKDKPKDKKTPKKYKSDLYASLKCDGLTIETFKKLNYRKYELTRLFSKYNSCKGTDFDNIYGKRTKTIVKLKVLAGLNFHPSFSNKFSYDFEFNLPPSAGGGRGYDSDYDTVDFDGQTNFSFGGEVEILLPVNRNKWSVFISPNYQSISDLSGSKEIGEYDFNYIIDLRSISIIEIPIGVRYYMNLNEKSQVFSHFAIATNFIVSSDYSQDLEQYNTNFSAELGNNSRKNYNVLFGAGINYKKFALGVNYYFEKNIRDGKNLNINSKGAVSLFGTYTIF